MLELKIMAGLLIAYYIFKPRKKKRDNEDCKRMHPDDIDEIIQGIVEQLEDKV